MRAFLSSLLLTLSLLLAGCASLFGSPPAPGETEQDVISKMGKPANRYQVGNQTLLEYPGGYFGQRTWMARMGPDGRLISLEQVRTTERFAQIKINESTKQDVLKLVGTPSTTSWLPWPQLEVWDYRYKENEVWNSIMSVQFDRSGIVRKLENGRDPMYETNDRSR